MNKYEKMTNDELIREYGETSDYFHDADCMCDECFSDGDRDQDLLMDEITKRLQECRCR